MESLVKNMKGQASVEFILLLSIAMLYLATVVLPAVEVSKKAADDSIQLAQARMSAEKLANTIDSVAVAGTNARQTITVFVPARGQIECSLGKITFRFYLTTDNTTPLLENQLCPKDAENKSVCSKEFETVSSSVNCDKQTIGDPSKNVPVTATAKIEKSNSGAINVYFS